MEEPFITISNYTDRPFKMEIKAGDKVVYDLYLSDSFSDVEIFSEPFEFSISDKGELLPIMHCDSISKFMIVENEIEGVRFYMLEQSA